MSVDLEVQQQIDLKSQAVIGVWEARNVCATLGVPGTVSGACKEGTERGEGETLRENTGGAIPRESSWMHSAQIVDWSGGITLRILENRGDIWQVQYWEASWKQYK